MSLADTLLKEENVTESMSYCTFENTDKLLRQSVSKLQRIIDEGGDHPQDSRYEREALGSLIASAKQLVREAEEYEELLAKWIAGEED